MSDPTRYTVTTVMGRDRGCCALCGAPVAGTRGEDWAIHHRRPRGAGGTSLAWVNLPANLILLHTACHIAVESLRAHYRALGFLVPLNGTLTADQVPIEHRLHGLVLLADDGTFEAV